MDEHPARALFRVSPAGYVAERSRLARLAKASGDKELGRLLQALKRPTLAMWAVAAVAAVADGVDEVNELVAVTEELAIAQGSGNRAATVEASRRRKASVATVVGVAVDVLQHWEPSAEARRAEIRTIVDQLSRHPELAPSWIDGTLRELPDADGFGFAAFTGMEVPDRSSVGATGKPDRRLKSVPPLPTDRHEPGPSAPKGRDIGDRGERELAEGVARKARAERAVAIRATRRDVDRALRDLAATQRKVSEAEGCLRDAKTTLRTAEADRDTAAKRHREAVERLSELTSD